jgi:hypothetical protein
MDEFYVATKVPHQYPWVVGIIGITTINGGPYTSGQNLLSSFNHDLEFFQKIQINY